MFRPIGPDRPARAPTTAPVVRGVVVALVALAALTGVKVGLHEAFGVSAPLVLYLVAVLVAAWEGGMVAGLVAVVGGAVLGHLLFFPSLAVPPKVTQEVIWLTLFALEGIAIAAVTTRARTERARATAALAEARTAAAKLDVILTGIDEGITVQDERGRLVYANRPAARLSGFDRPEDLLAATPAEIMARFEILTEDGRPFPLADLPGRKVLHGEPSSEATVRFRARGADEDRYSVVRANPVRDLDGALLAVVNTFRDVTEKRTQDEAVRLSQEWFATALRSIGDAVITTDRAGAITFVNPVAEQLTGWPAAEAMGRSLGEVFVILDEATRAPVENPVERVLRDGKVVGLANHTILVRRDGPEVAIDDSAAPIRGEGGALVGVVLVFRDVSIERLAEQRLDFLARAVQELNSSLDYEVTLATVARLSVPTIADWAAVDMIEDGQRTRLAVAHVDPAKIAFVAELERRYPQDPDAPSGAPHILRTGQAEMMSEIPAAVLEAAAQDAEHLGLLRELALHSYIGVPIKRGDRVLGVITFVTAESKRSYGEADLQLAQALADRAAVAVENALLYREARRARAESTVERDRLSALIMASPVAIAVLRGPELAFELINAPYLRMVPGAAIGRRPADLGVSAESQARLAAVMATGQPFSEAERPYTRALPDGRLDTIHTSYTVQPLFDGDGKVSGLVFFALDVTEQVQARQRVEAARAEAELANRSKDEFLAMLGHELRNPLAPILTALQLMNLRGGDAHAHEREVIERQVRHVVRLVDDLLDVSRITRGKVSLNVQRLEVADVIGDAIEQASPLLEQGRHVLATDVPRHGLAVAVDRQRMAQVIANLLTNSAKYTASGGRVELTAAREGDRVVIRVRDTGMGIAADILPRIFDLFVQQQQAIDRSRGGLGLGLTIVRNLVEAHAGQVTAYSDGPGKGSEFVIQLPAAAAPTLDEPAAAVPEAPARAAPRVLPRILIVDDNEDAADLLSMVLEAQGYITRVAHDGPSALLAAVEFVPHTALLDIGLPVMDGFELARRLRSTPTLDGLRLIALTGYGQETDRQRSKAAGFDHHLVKPIDVGKVMELLGEQ